MAATNARAAGSNTSGVRVSPARTYELRFRPGTEVITSASGALHTYNGCGMEIFQSLKLRPSNAVCSRDNESNCACTLSKLSAASDLYNLITRLSYARQIGCPRFSDRAA